MRRRICVVLLLWAGLAVAQTTPSPASSPVSGPPPAAPNASPAKPSTPGASQVPKSAPPAETEIRITPQQAEELFRSVDEILQFVSADTGLPIKRPVKRLLADRNQVAQYVESHMRDDEDAQRLERSAVVLKKFGLIPRDFDLQQFLLALLREQVAGYYDAKTQTVYLLDWVEPEQQKPVLAHELTHALQDQNFGLEKLNDDAKKDDPTGLAFEERLAAREAVIEGQGMIVLMDYMLAPMGSSVEQQPGLADAMQAGLTTTGPGMAVYNRAPLFLQQVLLFPYRYGTEFTKELLVAGGKRKAFMDVLQNPPSDTRQVMQPRTYLAGESVSPLRPAAFEKLAPGYQQWDLSAMGAFDVFLLMRAYATPESAKDLSESWRGGYYWAAKIPGAKNGHPFPAPADVALAYVSRWADATAASQFAGAYSQAVAKRYPKARQTQGLIAPMLKANPKRGVQVTITPQVTSPTSWETSDGVIRIEPHGDTVLILESFDPQTAKTIRDAILQ